MTTVLLEGLTVLRITLLVLCFPALLHAQTSEPQSSRQFWPELDIYWRLKPNVRLYFMSTRTKETDKETEIDVGAHIDFFVKRLIKLQRIAGGHIDESKASPLLLRAGYHFLASKSNPNEHRLLFEATPRYPLKAGAVVSMRNRLESRFQDSFSWRYRNRTTAERNFGTDAYQVTAYVRAEFYYDSRFSKWSRTAITAGSTFPIRRRSEIDLYFEHQNDTGKSPNRQIKAVGVAFVLHF